jgi:flagellar basal-body rod protein FlgB
VLTSIFDGTTIPLLEKVAVFGERRQSVLAANIANIDTPHYKRRDLPVKAFQDALRDAVERRSGGARAATANEVHDSLPRQLFQAIEAPSPSLTFQDNNNRSVENEVMEMTKNSLLQNFAIELMNAQMTMLQTAIRQQV